MKSISEILSGVIRASGFTPDALCSAGRCYDFANTAIRILEKNGHSAQLMTSDRYIQSKGDKIGWVEESVLFENPHAWVYSDGKHYDALDLEGVMKPLDMKFFKSQIMSYHYPDREERAYRLQNFGEVYSKELDKFVKKNLTENSITSNIPKFLYKWVRYDKFKKYLESKRLPVKKGYAHYIDSENNFVKGNSFTDKDHINRWSGDTLIRIDTSKISNKIFPIPGHRTYLKTMGITSNNYDTNAWKYESEEIDEYWIAGVLDLASAVIIKSYDTSITSDTIQENFSDGKKPGRKGLAKRMGVDCTKSVSELRKIAKKSSGEKQRMAHWCANMKAGRQRANESSQLTENYNSMSEEEQISWVSRRPDRIKFITDPTERVQLAAVEIDENVIHWIANPTERVQLIAIKYDPFLLYSIRNSTKQVQMIAVRENGILIVGPKNLDPSIFEDRQVKRAVLKAILENLEDDELVDMIYAVLEKHQVKWPELDKITAVRYRTPIKESRDLNSMSEEDQVAAVKRNGSMIYYIKNPSLHVQLAAVKQKGHAIRYIDNPSEQVKLAAVKESGILIGYIDAPSLEVQLAAVKQNGYAIRYIKNPSSALFNNPEVKQAVIRVLLLGLKSGKLIEDTLDYLDRHRVGWPELKKIREAMTRKPITPIKESLDYDLDYNSMSEEEQIRAVQENPGILYEIDKPSERVQIAAVLNDYAAISYIKPHLRSPTAITVSKIVRFPGTLFMSVGRDDLDPGAFQIPEVKTIVMKELLKHIKDNRRLEFLSLVGLLSELGVTWPEIEIAKTAWERRR